MGRPRLLNRLSEGAQGRLTLVSAPAGFGKTTMLASWLAEAGDRGVAWLSLDASDSDPTSFWAGVVATVSQAAPSVDAAMAGLVAGADAETVVTALLNALAEDTGELWLVLDDYHLAEGPAITAGMALLLEHLPSHVHVVLSTRADPDLSLARWRARGELVEVRAAELRFTSAEANDYLEEAAPVRLTEEQVRALEDRTEGWIAALQLAAVSLRGREDVAAFITGFTGDDRFVVDYLVEEVLAHQPPPVREFLLSSSVLDRLTGPLCDVLLDRDDGAAMLRTLERDNLFLVALDDRREWYRYHQLFADVLRARLLAEQPDVVPLLHRRASDWCAEHDLRDEAIAHALAAGDVDRAATLVELAVPEVRRHRQEAKMRGWLDALPDDTVRRSPVLCMFEAALLLAAGDLDATALQLDEAERALATKPGDGQRPWADTIELRTLPATIAMYRSSVAQARGDVANTEAHARRALALAGTDDHLARGGAQGFLAMAAWSRGDVLPAFEIFTDAVASLRDGGDLVDGLGGTVVLADLSRAAGRPLRAHQLCEQALSRAEDLGAPVARAAAELRVVLAELDVEAGQLGRARAHLEAASALTERTPFTESRFRHFVATALMTAAHGDVEAALRHLDRAEQLHRPGFFPDVRPIPALRARLHLSAGDLTAAGDWASGRGFSHNDPSKFMQEYDHLTLVRFLLALQREGREPDAGDRALALLEPLRVAATASRRAGSLVEIRLLTALAHDAQGRSDEALHCLADALTLAPEPEGWARVFLDEGAPALHLLRAVDATDASGSADDAGAQARRVLASAPSGTGAGPNTGPPGIRQPAEGLSERELEVLRLLDTELSGPEIARALFISTNTLRTHTKHVFTKLGVTSRRAAVARARERGLLGPGAG
ncbi:MAG: LuxR C-terminal-related transcriptional regulator [Ornithinibacter sp.]